MHSFCQHLKGLKGDVRVIEDTDFVLQRLPLFKMLIKSLLGFAFHQEPGHILVSSKHMNKRQEAV